MKMTPEQTKQFKNLEYKYAVEGYESTDSSAAPMFTNCVKTEVGRDIVRERLMKQGLAVVVRTMSDMRGLNPYYEEVL